MRRSSASTAGRDEVGRPRRRPRAPARPCGPPPPGARRVAGHDGGAPLVGGRVGSYGESGRIRPRRRRQQASSGRGASRGSTSGGAIVVTQRVPSSARPTRPRARSASRRGAGRTAARRRPPARCPGSPTRIVDLDGAEAACTAVDVAVRSPVGTRIRTATPRPASPTRPRVQSTPSSPATLDGSRSRSSRRSGSQPGVGSARAAGSEPSALTRPRLRPRGWR